MNVRKFSIVGGLLLLVIGFVLTKKLGDTPAPEAKKTLPKSAAFASVTTVKNSAIKAAVKINGRLEAKDKITVYADASGVLKEGSKPFKEGMYFSEGETFFSIDDTEVRLNLEAQKSQLKSLITTLVLDVDDTEAQLNIEAQKSKLLSTITALLPDISADFPDRASVWQQYVNNFDTKRAVPTLPTPTSDREKYFLDARNVNNLYLTIKSQERSLNKFYDLGTVGGNSQAWKRYLENFDIKKDVPALPQALSGREKYFVATKNIENLYYNIKSQEERLRKHHIIAPFNGTVSKALLHTGTLVRSGQQIGDFINTSAYELAATVPLQDAKFFKKGNKVTLYSDATTGTWAGTVSRIGKSIDPTTQTLGLYIALSGKGLNEGMYLNGDITSEVINDALKVSRNLLIDDNTAIYSLYQDSLLKKQPIQLIKFVDNEAIIKGVPDNTTIISEPILGSYEGMPVKVLK